HIACPPAVGGIRLGTGIHQHQRSHTMPPASHELESHIRTHGKPTKDDLIYAEGVEQRREVGGVDRHGVAQIGSIAPTHAPQIGRNPTKSFESSDLIRPYGSIEGIAVYE